EKQLEEELETLEDEFKANSELKFVLEEIDEAEEKNKRLEAKAEKIESKREALRVQVLRGENEIDQLVKKFPGLKVFCDLMTFEVFESGNFQEVNDSIKLIMAKKTKSESKSASKSASRSKSKSKSTEDEASTKKRKRGTTGDAITTSPINAPQNALLQLDNNNEAEENKRLEAEENKRLEAQAKAQKAEKKRKRQSKELKAMVEEILEEKEKKEKKEKKVKKKKKKRQQKEEEEKKKKEEEEEEEEENGGNYGNDGNASPPPSSLNYSNTISDDENGYDYNVDEYDSSDNACSAEKKPKRPYRQSGKKRRKNYNDGSIMPP
ncbi:hypothetical protein ScalyP_jg8249, partial [Parmales sp. scaly parma]